MHCVHRNTFFCLVPLHDTKKCKQNRRPSTHASIHSGTKAPKCNHGPIVSSSSCIFPLYLPLFFCSSIDSTISSSKLFFTLRIFLFIIRWIKAQRDDEKEMQCVRASRIFFIACCSVNSGNSTVFSFFFSRVFSRNCVRSKSGFLGTIRGAKSSAKWRERKKKGLFPSVRMRERERDLILTDVGPRYASHPLLLMH